MIRFKVWVAPVADLLKPDTTLDLRTFFETPIKAELNGPADEIAALFRGAMVARCEAQPAREGIAEGEIDLL